MRLQKLLARNFRLLEDFEIEFSPEVTVLIGSNYVGKSSVIEAILAARHTLIASSPLYPFVNVVSKHDNTTRRLILELRLVEQSGWQFSLISEESAQGFHGARVVVDGVPAQDLTGIRNFFLSIANIDAFRNVGFFANVAPKETIVATGLDLPQILHYQYTNNREKFDGYEEIITKVLPDVDIIETPLVGPGQTTTRVRFRGDPSKYDLSSLSSGIKDVLVLIAAAYFSLPGSLILMEEPENHLHPTAQKALCTVFSQLARREQKQFILTTHSEFILGQFDASQCVFIERVDSGSKAIPLKDVDVYSAWQRLGIDRSRLLEVLGRTRQVVVITEAREDAKVLEALIRGDRDLSDSVLPSRAEGGGWADIIRYAAQLRDALGRFRIPSAVFVLLDNDGERTQKSECLSEYGFDESSSHVWDEKEIESYLLRPVALAAISGKPMTDVEELVAEGKGVGKPRLQWVLRQLGIEETPLDVIVTNERRNNPDKLPTEFIEVVEKLRRLC